MTNNTDIVNELKKFFTNKIPNISSKTINDYPRNKNDHSLFLEPTNEVDVHSVVTQFSAKRSMNYHDINIYCIKYIIASITKHLMHICNLSFSTGIFQDEMKIARVIPKLKNKNINEFKNFGLISISSQF